MNGCCVCPAWGLERRSPATATTPRRPHGRRGAVPYRAATIENRVQGNKVRDTTRQAAALIRTLARPMSQNAYKVDIAQTLVERTLFEGVE